MLSDRDIIVGDTFFAIENGLTYVVTSLEPNLCKRWRKPRSKVFIELPDDAEFDATIASIERNNTRFLKQELELRDFKVLMYKHYLKVDGYKICYSQLGYSIKDTETGGLPIIVNKDEYNADFAEADSVIAFLQKATRNSGSARVIASFNLDKPVVQIGVSKMKSQKTLREQLSELNSYEQKVLLMKTFPGVKDMLAISKIFKAENVEEALDQYLTTKNV
jgi:hypothetical protein